MATDEGLELPEEIIQHIQSFMECKVSAQTSLLSKKWYKAWSTLPNLNFRDFYFLNSSMFWDFVTKTVQRYIHLNVKVDKFVLPLTNTDVCCSLVDKLIIDALQLRMNVLDLYFDKDASYVLPAQVLANKYLTQLRLHGVKVDHLIHVNVICSNLRSLTLEFVFIGDNTFTNILIRCPLIEHLDLCFLKTPLTRINATELQNLKTLIVQFNHFASPDITSSVICGQFLNLTGLKLSNVRVADSFFTNFSSNFPKLEDLTLESLDGDPNVQISSRSIKRLSLIHYGMLKMANFDVPNIQYFKFEGVQIPPLSFNASSNEWNSYIFTLAKFDGLYLSKLRELLIKLRRSKITLQIIYTGRDRNICPERNIENIHLPQVEELSFSAEFCEAYNFFVECLLLCRPKLVSLRFCKDYGPDTISTQFMYKKLIERTNQNAFSS